MKGKILNRLLLAIPLVFIITACGGGGGGGGGGEPTDDGGAETIAPTTTASPSGGYYLNGQTVTLACSDSGGSGCDATYFTLDGSEPTENSTAYVAPVSIDQDSQLRFFSVDKDNNQEDWLEEEYVVCATSANTDDNDNDSLTTCDELKGWDILVNTNGRDERVVRVFSNPHTEDSDQDGHSDYEEYLDRIDPSSLDTDGDGLNDYVEIEQYGSIPYDVDSDDDSRGDSGTATPHSALFDGSELRVYGTSPISKDTDGDDLSDYNELVENLTNARRANLPVLDIEFVGDIDVQLNAQSDSGCRTEGELYVGTLNRETSSASQADSRVNEVGLEMGATVRTGMSAQAFPPNTSGEVSAELSISGSIVNTDSASWTRASSETAQQEFNQRYTQGCFNNLTVNSGYVKVAFTITNNSDVAVNVDDLSVTLVRKNPNNPSSFTTLGSVQLLSGGAGVGANGGLVDVQAITVEVPMQQAMALLADPSGLVFRVSTYQMSDETGRNYIFIENTTLRRTGLLVIDYGDGTVKRHLIATNVLHDAQGDPQGITLGEILADVLDLDYDTQVNPTTGATTLTSLDGHAMDQQLFRYWYALGTHASFNDNAINIEDKVLNQGDSIYLILAQDRDGDLLWDREEYLFGTDPTVADTDSDNLTDFTEVKVGWQNDFDQSQVYSSPFLPDTDGDGLQDDDEMANHANPYLADTDADGMNDPDEVGFGLNPARWQAVVKSVAGGAGHGVAVLADGSLWAWGSNSDGQLGLGTTDHHLTPRPVGEDKDWRLTSRAISAGLGHTLAIKQDGTLWAWGNNDLGQLGMGDKNGRISPTQVGSEDQWYAVDTSNSHTLALRTGEGRMYAWGSNKVGNSRAGNLCDGFDDVDEYLAPIQRSINIRQIAAGNFLSLFTRRKDTNPWLYGCGYNGNLVIRDSGVEYYRSLQGAHYTWYDQINRISTTRHYAVAITDTGTAKVFGNTSVFGNGLGEFNVTGNTDLDVLVDSVIDTKSGWYHTLLLLENGEIWSWGGNEYGQLGRPSNDTCDYQGVEACDRTATRVGNDSDWAAISAGSYVSFGIKENGTLWAWGYNWATGTNAQNNRNTPTRVFFTTQ